MPSWSSLNPFGNEEQEVTKVDMSSPEPSTQIVAAQSPVVQPTISTTEMDEMQRVMGSVPTFNDRVYEETIVEENVVELTPADLPLTEAEVSKINADIKQSMAETPTPDTKPDRAEKIAIVEDAIKETVETTADKMIEVADTPPTAPMPEPTPQVIAPVIAQATSPQMTDEQAMFNESDLKLSSASGCPAVKIMPAGRSITYFENELSGSVVARAVINEIKGGCEVVNGGLEVDLDILMNGKITDKGRFEGRKDMEAFMTFPYFVAVTTPQGLPVDKKIMATAMRFKPVINDLNHAEKITQFIPMNNTAEAANYTITVGFQLNRKQLEYNRARNINRVNNMRIAPDLQRNPSRLSLDPLAD
jgi:hypothetical protein